MPIQTVGYLFIDVLHYLKLNDAPQYTMIGLVVAVAVAALFAQLRRRAALQFVRAHAHALGLSSSIVRRFLSFALFAIGHQFGPLVFALMINGLGFGLVRPGYAAAASLSVDPHEQGAIAGLTGATSGAGFIFGPMIATGLYRISPQAPYIFGAVLIADHVSLCASLSASAQRWPRRARKRTRGGSRRNAGSECVRIIVWPVRAVLCVHRVKNAGDVSHVAFHLFSAFLFEAFEKPSGGRPRAISAGSA